MILPDLSAISLDEGAACPLPNVLPLGWINFILFSRWISRPRAGFIFGIIKFVLILGHLEYR